MALLTPIAVLHSGVKNLLPAVRAPFSPEPGADVARGTVELPIISTLDGARKWLALLITVVNDPGRSVVLCQLSCTHWVCLGSG